VSHPGGQTARMRNEIPSCNPAANPLDAVPPLTAVVSVATAAAAIVVPTLVALTHGWDYRLAVLFGALMAVACLIAGRRCLPATDVEGHHSVELAAGFAAVLFCVYASDWLDWRPFGLDDAFAGLAVGLVLFVAGPARRVLRNAASAPNDASLVLQLLAIAPAGAALLVLAFTDVPYEVGHTAFLLVGFGASLILAWLGTAVALRHGLLGTAFVLSVLSGLALYGLLTVSDAPWSHAGVFGALAGAWPPLVALYLWRNSAPRPDVPPEDLLAWIAVALCFSLLLEMQPIPWFIAAGALGAWWWGYYRRGRSALARQEPMRGSARRAVLSAASFGSTAILSSAYGLLFVAAALNLTGPMFLAMLGEIGLYRVADLTFSEALLADQYLWRDQPASARFMAAASPERLVRLKRTEHDRWSRAVQTAQLRAREEHRPDGMGLKLGEDGEGGLRIAYVYPGSPGHAAGLRRGDVIAAVDGKAITALGANGTPKDRPVGPVRLGLQRPDAPPRELTIASARYDRPSLSLQKTIESGGRRVGYILLHGFDRSALVGFRDAAVTLLAQGIDDLVLDLRMNPGGSVVVARDIASAIGGRRLDGATFQRLVYNERYRDRDEDFAFRAHGRGVLALPRVFVITSEETCSASEALINGLAPHMTVVTLGTTTCGKPVGMSVVDYGDLSYWVITFRVLNSRGEGDYFSGLPPTCEAEDDFTRELGDPDEASLAAALHYVRVGRCPDRSTNAQRAR